MSYFWSGLGQMADVRSSVFLVASWPRSWLRLVQQFVVPGHRSTQSSVKACLIHDAKTTLCRRQCMGLKSWPILSFHLIPVNLHSSRLHTTTRSHHPTSTMKFLAPILALAAVAVATESSGSSAPMCCKDVKNSSQVDSFTKTLIKTLIGVDISGLNVPIGTGCTPIAVLGGVSW
jgi:hypothetical protein